MTNKVVVIINSLKITKIKKILLYEMKFLASNYSCLQNPWLGSYRSQIPLLSVLCPQLNLLNLPRTKFLGTSLICMHKILSFRKYNCTCILKKHKAKQIFQTVHIHSESRNRPMDHLYINIASFNKKILYPACITRSCKT